VHFFALTFSSEKREFERVREFKSSRERERVREFKREREKDTLKLFKCEKEKKEELKKQTVQRGL